METYYTYHYYNGNRVKRSEYKDTKENIIKFGNELSRLTGQMIIVKMHYPDNGKMRSERIAVCNYPF